MLYLNLTNGIEYLNDVEEPYSFIRIQSTTLERKLYEKLVLELDYAFLLNLALGKKVIVIDYGTNRKNSKTISRGIPIIKYILNRFWYDIDEDVYFLSQNTDKKVKQTEYVKHIYNQLFTYNRTKEKEKVISKLRYFKRYLNSDRVYLEGKSFSTNNDGDYPYYSILLKEKHGI